MSIARGRPVDNEYSQFLVDQVAVMVKKEEEFYSRADYLGDLPEPRGDSIDEGWRQKAVEWMFKVIDYYVSFIVFVAKSTTMRLTSCVVAPEPGFRIWIEIS
jgi:hypothetical protein